MYGDCTKKSRYHTVTPRYSFIKIAPGASSSLHLMKTKQNKVVEVESKIQFRAMADDEYEMEIDQESESRPSNEPHWCLPFSLDDIEDF